MKRKLGKTLCSVFLSLTMIFGLIPGIGLTSYADSTEELLTTITATGRDTYSQSVDGVVTVTLANMMWYDGTYGWLYSGTITVEPVEGYTITRCRFIQNDKTPLDDDLAPFSIVIDPEDGVSVITSTGQKRGGRMDGVTSIEVYGYANTVDVTGVELNHDSLSLEVGETYDLVAEITPDDATDTTVTWSSDDEQVATVDNDGVVTAVAAGTTTITVTATNGTDVTSDDKTATCTVTVTDSDTPTPDPDPDTPTPDPDPVTPDPEPVTPSDTPAPVITPEQIQRLAVEHFVDRLYVECLGRTYDKTGRDAWADVLMAGGSASAVARGFFGSPEFLNRDLTNEEFVTILYKVFYDSVPQTGSYTNWVDALYNDTMTRSELIDSFISSYEWASFCARYGVNV